MSLRILQDIQDLKDNQLTGKFYTPSVTLQKSNTPREVTANPIPNSWTPVNLSIYEYANGNYRIMTNAERDITSTILPMAFDSNSSTQFHSKDLTVLNPYITVELPTALTVTKVKYRVVNKDITQVDLDGSNNNSTWDNLLSVPSGSGDTITEYALRTTGEYKYYRLTSYRSAPYNGTSFYEFQFSGYLVYDYTAHLTLPEIPNPLNTYQRILIRTPEYSITGVSDVTFNGKPVDTLLRPNRYYELMYDGNTYLTREVV